MKVFLLIFLLAGPAGAQDGLDPANGCSVTVHGDLHVNEGWQYLPPWPDPGESGPPRDITLTPGTELMVEQPAEVRCMALPEPAGVLPWLASVGFLYGLHRWRS